MNWQLLYAQLPNLLSGAAMTMLASLIAVPMGVCVGLVIAIMRLSRRALFNLPAGAYVAAFRGTPMLVQILLFYYGLFPGLQDLLEYLDILPKLGLEWLNFRTLPAIYAGVTTLSLNSGAYLGEIFRGGIQSIDKGQGEAAMSLGMSKYQIMRYIILPQALANALPSICNEFITLVKDSSLLQAIAVPELLNNAMLAAARTYEYRTMYFGIAMIYFVMTFILYRLLDWVEKRMRAGYK